ncbi:hypothetical protein SPPR111872_22520 [Sphingobacterium prati]
MENNRLKILLPDNRRKGNIDIDLADFSLSRKISQSKKQKKSFHNNESSFFVPLERPMQMDLYLQVVLKVKEAFVNFQTDHCSPYFVQAVNFQRSYSVVKNQMDLVAD